MGKWGDVKTYEITLLNWDKYQGEGKKWDKTRWYRQVNTEYEHVLWDILDDSEYRAWSFLKQYISKSGHLTGSITIAAETAQRLANVKPRAFRSVIEKLAAPGLEIIAYSELTRSELGVDSESTSSEEGKKSALRNVTVRNETKHNTTATARARSEGVDHSHPLIMFWDEFAGEKLGTFNRLATSAEMIEIQDCWRRTQDRDYWRALFARVVASPFLTGSGKSGWKATFDWIIEPGNIAKVESGNYDAKKSGNQDLYDRNERDEL